MSKFQYNFIKKNKNIKMKYSGMRKDLKIQKKQEKNLQIHYDSLVVSVNNTIKLNVFISNIFFFDVFFYKISYKQTHYYNCTETDATN